jgi:hypothetical protein
VRFYWWVDAYNLALELARATQIRHRVVKTPRGWAVRALLEVTC